MCGNARQNLVAELKEVSLNRYNLLKNLAGLLHFGQVSFAGAAEECAIGKTALLSENSMAHGNVIGYVSEPLVHDIEHGQRVSLPILEHLIIDGDGVTELINNHQVTKMLVERLTPNRPQNGAIAPSIQVKEFAVKRQKLFFYSCC